MTIGKTSPENPLAFVDRPSEYPDLRKRMPIQIPKARPASPTMAFEFFDKSNRLFRSIEKSIRIEIINKEKGVV